MHRCAWAARPAGLLPLILHSPACLHVWLQADGAGVEPARLSPTSLPTRPFTVRAAIHRSRLPARLMLADAIVLPTGLEPALNRSLVYRLYQLGYKSIGHAAISQQTESTLIVEPPRLGLGSPSCWEGILIPY